MKPYYQQSGVTIYHGDCREVMDELWESERFGSTAFDLLLTDPPYGIGFAAQPTKWQRRAGQKPEEWDNAQADPESLSIARSLCRRQIIWGGNYYSLPISPCWLSWFKPDAPPSMGNVEYAWTNLERNSRQFTFSISATNSERVGHPTQKPEAVIRWVMGQVPVLAQSPSCVAEVFDPFMGSGTTLVAAKRLGRTAIGIEINESYCELAAKRLRQDVLPLEVACYSL